MLKTVPQGLMKKGFLAFIAFIMALVLVPVGLSSRAEAAAGSWWQPAAANPIHWQWQIGTPFNTSTDIIPNVTVYDLDGFDTSAATVAALHSMGCKVIAYFSFGTSENWRSDYSLFTSSIKGKTNGWAGENWIDIRSDVVKSIMSARMDLAASKGFDGLEPDNVDGYSNSTGFPLTAQDQLNFNEWIASTAHSKGLSVGLKNDVDQASTLQPYFDWMLDEQSYEYSEYNTLLPFVNANKAVFEVEYGNSTPQATTMNGLHINSMTRDLDLVAPGSSGYVRIPCIPDTQNTWNGSTQTTGTTSEMTSSRPTQPAVITGMASSITTSGATLNGNVISLGTANSVQVSFLYGTSSGEEVTVVNVDKSPMSEAGAFAAKINDLITGKTYYYRAIAGSVKGNEVSFTVATSQNSLTTITNSSVKIEKKWVYIGIVILIVLIVSVIIMFVIGLICQMTCLFTIRALVYPILLFIAIFFNMTLV